MQQVRELRLVLTVQDFDAALSFYRDALGLEVEGVWASEGGHVTLLSARHATLELVDKAHATEIDRLEVGHHVAGPVRVAFQVSDDSGAVFAHEYTIQGGAAAPAFDVEAAATLRLDYTGMLIEVTNELPQLP